MLKEDVSSLTVTQFQYEMMQNLYQYYSYYYSL